MATTVKRHDTWPAVRFKASDQDGLLPLEDADSLKFIIKSGSTVVVEGVATSLDPNTNDGFNGQYLWAEGDTDNVANLQIELEITWDANSDPPRIETIPNSGVREMNIEADLA